MSAISTIDEYPAEFQDRYWEVVTACLVEIFNMDIDGAEKASSSLRKKYEAHLSPEGQLLVYHEEALYTAAILAFGADFRETAKQLHQYRKICKRLGWTR